VARVLLLESDRQLAKCIKAFMATAGYSTNAYTDPQAAILAADNNWPDLIILDLQLAGRSGIEFLYELRSYPEWQTIPVIITGRLSHQELTAYSDSFKQLNVGAYLHRPAMSLAGLLQQVRELLHPVSMA